MDDRCNILVVEEHGGHRRNLVKIIEKEIKPKRCLEANNIESASETIERYSVAYAIVEIHPKSKKGMKLAEEIKLSSPMLPILEVLVERDDFNYVNNSDKKVTQYEINRIISGIRYMQSLTNSGISGFTVAVNI
jgi:DNA-binding NtrC family response regulator